MNLFRRRKPEILAPKPRVEPRWKGLSEAASRASAPERAPSPDLFHVPELPPSVGGAKLAMDEDIGAYNGWANAQMMNASFFGEGVTFLGYAYLSELAQRPEYRVMVETLATEMTRKWIKFVSTDQEDDRSERIKELEEAFQALDVRGAFAKAAEYDGFFGRGHVYVDTGDTDKAEELRTSLGDGWNRISRSKVSTGRPIRALRPVEPVWTYPTTYNSFDPLSPDWYNPREWYVQSKIVHESRLLKFIGREVPDLLKPTYSFGGLALTQMAKPYVDNWLKTRQSVNDIISAFSVFVLKTNLLESVQMQGDDLFRRVELFNNLRDNRGVLVVDKDLEEFANVAAPLNGLDSLQAQAQEHMASVSHIPIVKLLGVQPAGLNATSEGELRAFYDYIHSFQEKLFRARLRQVMGLVMLSIWDETDEGIDFEFEPLYALDEVQMATVNKTKADTDASLIDSGIIAPEEARATMANDPDRGYGDIDPEEVPDLGEEELGGLEPQGGRPEPAAQAEQEQELTTGDSLSVVGDESKWEESKHPRQKDGKFGEKSTSSSGTSKASKITDMVSEIAPGFKKDYESLAFLGLTHEETGHGLVYNLGKDTWSIYDGDVTLAAGTGPESLEANLLQMQPEEQPGEEEKSSNTPTSSALGVFDYAKEYGFKHDADLSSKQTLILTGPGNKLAINLDGKWTLQSSGHLSKSGEGKEALQALLKGSKEEWQAAGVHNTTSSDPSLTSNSSSTAANQPSPEHVELLSKIKAARPKPANSYQQQAIGAYKGAGYQSINGSLRNTGKDGLSADHLHEWLAGAEIPEDCTLYRGIRGSYSTVLRSILDVGAEFVDRGFMSTTTSKNFAHQWAMTSSEGLLLEIKVKKGTRGAAITSGDDGEYEVLMQSHSRLRVLEFNFEARHAVVELIQDEKASAKPQPPAPPPPSAPQPVVIGAEGVPAPSGTPDYKKNPNGYVISVVSQKNPKKSGSKGALAFEKYVNGMTPAEFKAAVGSDAWAHLNWDLQKGFVKLSPKG